MNIISKEIFYQELQIQYNQEHRYYHNWNHIQNMINNFDKFFMDKISEKEKEYLMMAILFHDIIYDIHKNDNEEKSFEYFENHKISKEFNIEEIYIIKNLIMVTKTLFPKTDLEKIMLFLDWSIFLGNEQELSNYNYAIFKEYQEYNFLVFSVERQKFFNTAPSKILNSFNGCEFIDNILKEKLKEGITTAQSLFLGFKPKIGVYAGSFNPFHIGHYHILKKSEEIFDKVILVQAINSEKNNERMVFPKLKREQVTITDNKFIGEILDELKSKFEHSLTLVRGIRTGHDLIAEQSYQQTIKELGCNYHIVHILCDPEFQHISSTMIRGAMKISDNTKKWIILDI
jgi:cytidyltransferase-like protein